MTEGQELDAAVSDVTKELGDYAKSDAPRAPRMLEMRLSVQMTKRDVELGHYFLVDRNVEQGEDPIITDIGETVNCTVLQDSMKLSMWDDDLGKTVAETSEFSDYQNDLIFLFDNFGDNPYIAAICPYTGPTENCIKNLRQGEKYTGLKFQYLAYVLLDDGRIVCFKNSARGHLGTDDKGNILGFNDISDNSFMKVRGACKKETKGLTCGHKWVFGAVPVAKGEKDVRPAFKLDGLITDAKVLSSVKDALQKLSAFMQGRYANKISYAWKNTDAADRETMVADAKEKHRFTDMLSENGGEHDAALVALGKGPKRDPSSALIASPTEDEPATPEDVEEVFGKDEKPPKKGKKEEEVDEPGLTESIKAGQKTKIEDVPF